MSEESNKRDGVTQDHRRGSGGGGGGEGRDPRRPTTGLAAGTDDIYGNVFHHDFLDV